MRSAQELIVRRRPRRSLNVVALLVMFAGVLALAAFVVFLISKLGPSQPAYADSGAPNGAPSTMKATDVAGPDASAWRSPAPSTPPPVTQPQAQSTQPPQAAQPPPQRASSGDDGSAARDAARRHAEALAKAEEARRQRLADAMRSMGGVAIADTSDDDAQATPDPQEVPSGPVLGIGTRIPISVTQSMDSTFGGTFSVSVTDDVFDEHHARVLISRGSTCFGNTSAGGVDGQQRIYGAVTLCKLPNFSRVSLDSFPLVDADGATGLKARVDDHGAGRRNRGNVFSSVPSMLAGTLIPGVGGMVASSAASAAASSGAGRAIPGPTLFVDASPQKPRAAAILVTRDIVIGGSE